MQGVQIGCLRIRSKIGSIPDDSRGNECCHCPCQNLCLSNNWTIILDVCCHWQHRRFWFWSESDSHAAQRWGRKRAPRFVMKDCSLGEMSIQIDKGFRHPFKTLTSTNCIFHCSLDCQLLSMQLCLSFLCCTSTKEEALFSPTTRGCLTVEMSANSGNNLNFTGTAGTKDQSQFRRPHDTVNLHFNELISCLVPNVPFPWSAPPFYRRNRLIGRVSKWSMEFASAKSPFQNAQVVTSWRTSEQERLLCGAHCHREGLPIVWGWLTEQSRVFASNAQIMSGGREGRVGSYDLKVPRNSLTSRFLPHNRWLNLTRILDRRRVWNLSPVSATQ